MAKDINSIVIVGRLTRDAELKSIANGTSCSKFSIANNRMIKQGDTWIEEVSFFDCTLWGTLASKLDQYLKKGKQVGISGELRQSRWEKDGQARSRVEINVNTIQLLGKKEDWETQPAQQAQAPPVHDDDIPF
jgi:single-strand DNA-binding protein